jgi:hypothetical protein
MGNEFIKSDVRVNGTVKNNDGIFKGTGLVLNNQFNGKGKFLSYDKNIYLEGTFKYGELYGIGIKKINNKIYKGMFKNGKINGKGIKIINNRIYDGFFINDKLFGNGKIYYDNDFIYEGAVEKDLPHGFGKKYHKNINIFYEGIFKDGEIINGTYHKLNQFIYNGQFSKFKFNGNGTIEYYDSGLDIISYTGSFNNGDVIGTGTIKYKNGNIFDGLVQSNTPVHGKLTFTNGNVFVGDIFCNLYDGMIILENGNKILGLFDINLLSKCVIFINDKIIYIGPMKNGNFHGIGKLFNRDCVYENLISITIAKFIEGNIYKEYSKLYIDSERFNSIFKIEDYRIITKKIAASFTISSQNEHNI